MTHDTSMIRTLRTGPVGPDYSECSGILEIHNLKSRQWELHLIIMIITSIITVIILFWVGQVCWSATMNDGEQRFMYHVWPSLLRYNVQSEENHCIIIGNHQSTLIITVVNLLRIWLLQNHSLLSKPWHSTPGVTDAGPRDQGAMVHQLVRGPAHQLGVAARHHALRLWPSGGLHLEANISPAGGGEGSVPIGWSKRAEVPGSSWINDSTAWWFYN